MIARLVGCEVEFRGVEVGAFVQIILGNHVLVRAEMLALLRCLMIVQEVKLQRKTSKVIVVTLFSSGLRHLVLDGIHGIVIIGKVTIEAFKSELRLCSNSQLARWFMYLLIGVKISFFDDIVVKDAGK